MGCVLVGMRDQLLVSVGEIRREFGDRLVEAVEVANQSSLVVVVRGPAAVGELTATRPVLARGVCRTL
jgi:hypothetical protein